ncbi:hypothetical protein RHMOL_Rhmol08G0147200 [Rhododendron molle]|uniref:Uncharacterized protein n=1 Tax=Rhododendron molle TaxID=49168 RepID=A0ACC0MNU4_RHOML|nr:hypothetical protein RHMOL_Rhmol08G0147200 [Rhododendron molle]
MTPNRLRDFIMNDSDFSDSDDELEFLEAIASQKRLFDDHFAELPVFPPHFLRRRFRMSRSLFLHIHDAVVEHDSYFAQKRNCAGKLGLSSLQKITGVLRMLAYGAPTDSVDEYVRIGASIAINSLNLFVKAVNEVFSEKYLRSPNAANIARFLAVNKSCGFLGCWGALIVCIGNGRIVRLRGKWATFVKTIPS